MGKRWMSVMPVATLAAFFGLGSWLEAAESRGFELAVLVDGAPRPELFGHGKIYVEALRGRNYTLRMHNPLPCRVAVALSVDGLNSIDARHTRPQDARKWVLDPYETIDIEGWQVSGDQARLFYFTGERDSYAARRGQSRNIGVIEAVFYREKQPHWIERRFCRDCDNERFREQEESKRLGAAPRADAPAAAAESARQKSAPQLSDEYAATGMGGRVENRVQRVNLDLESIPAATVLLRYEFRPQLVRLGLLPAPHRHDPLDRRESAHGFDGPYCPDL